VEERKISFISKKYILSLRKKGGEVWPNKGEEKEKKGRLAIYFREKGESWKGKEPWLMAG